jgi:hypothetical protein
MVCDVPYVGGVESWRKIRTTVIAIAAAGVMVGAAACSASGTHHAAGGNAAGGNASGQPGAQSSGGGRSATSTWSVLSCQVDVEYIDEATTADYYVPDTSSNFRHVADNDVSGGASMAVVVTLVNHTVSKASLPTGMVVSFTDQSGSHVGSAQSFNNANGTGYGAAVTHGRGSGEKFSSTTLFNAGQTVSESPDIGTSVPQRPNLNCQARQQ